MADVNKVLCCASSPTAQRCASCQDSCSCARGCQCSSTDLKTLQISNCAGGDVKKGNGDVCGCSQQCPCRKAGCATGTIEANLCSNDNGTVPSCTMPGNCACDKGSIGKL